MRYDCTLFIKGIPEELPDTIVHTALNAIPGFSSFIRCSQYDNKPTSFGFAEFSSARFLPQAVSVLSTAQILKNEPEKRLLVKVDQSRGDGLAVNGDAADPPDPSLVQQVTTVFFSWINAKDSGVLLGNTKSDTSSDNAELSNDVYEAVRRSLNEDQSLNEIVKDLTQAELERLKNEIREFRKESLVFERKRGQEAEVYEKKSQSQLLQDSSTKLQVTAKLIDVSEDLAGGSGSEYTYNDEGDWDFEIKKQELVKAAADRDFHEQQRRWIHREEYRMSAFKKKLDSDKELSEDQKQARINKYRDFDDDDFEMRQSLEYYTNHAAWARKRKDYRARELRHDIKDAEEEKEETSVSIDKSGVTEELTSVQEPAVQNASTSSTTTKISLSFNRKASSSTNGLAEATTEEEEDKRSLKPLQEKPLQADTDAQTQTLSEESIKSIQDSLPQDMESLSNYSVKWDHLTDIVIEDILRPFVVKSIVEYLGIEEEELVEFILSHIRDHKPLAELVSELEVTLDEDAPGFSVDLWKLLILESEKEASRTS